MYGPGSFLWDILGDRYYTDDGVVYSGVDYSYENSGVDGGGLWIGAPEDINEPDNASGGFRKVYFTINHGVVHLCNPADARFVRDWTWYVGHESICLKDGLNLQEYFPNPALMSKSECFDGTIAVVDMRDIREYFDCWD
jgi:hypothetical protein